MPSFSESGELKFAALTTGPHHVRIGLLVDDEPSTDVRLVALPPIGGCDHGPWDTDALVVAVREGLAKAGRRFGVALHPREIHYVANDTPSCEMAARCAFLIGERLAGGLSFSEGAG